MHVVMFVDKRTQASRFEVFFSFNLHGCDYVVVLYQEINFFYSHKFNLQKWEYLHFYVLKSVVNCIFMSLKM